MNQPCLKDCPGRSAECHANCEKWKTYQEWKTIMYRQRNMEKESQVEMSRRGLKYVWEGMRK